MNRFLMTCLMSILLLMPRYIYSAAIAEAAMKVGELTAEKLVTDTLAKISEEIGADAFEKLSQEALTKSLTTIAADLMEETTGKLTGLSADALTKTTEAAAKAIEDVFTDSVFKMSQESLELTGTALEDALAKVTTNLSEDVAEKTVTQLGSDLNEMVNKAASEASAKAIAESGAEVGSEAAAKAGQEAATKASQEAATKASAIMDEVTMSKVASEALVKEAGTSEAAAEEALTKATKAAETAEENLARFKKFGVDFGKLLGETLKMSVVSIGMMIPQSLMTAIAAENARNALLANITSVIKIGKYVLQIPDQFINITDPSKSIFLYAIVPSASTTQDVPTDAAQQWPGWYGLGSDNPISKSFSVAASAGDSMHLVDRYTFDPEFLQTAFFACTAPAASYSTTLADTYMNSSSASGINLVLNNGSKFVADGTDGGNDAIPLVGSASSGFTLKSIMTYFNNKIDSESQTYSYTQYLDTNATKEGDSATTTGADGTSSDVMDRLFDCACLESGDYSNLDKTCSTTENGSVLATCMLANTMAKIQAGLVIDGKGQEVTNSAISEGEALTEAQKAGQAQSETASEYDASNDVGYQIANTILGAAFQGLGSVVSGIGKPAETKTATEPTAAAPLDSLAKTTVAAQALTTDSADSSDVNALGGVIPVFGWGDGFTDMLQAFTSTQTLTAESAGALTAELANADGSKPSEEVSGALVNNYAAQGVQVYLSGNTAFTRELRSMMGLKSLQSISEMSPTGAIADIIVFLDKDNKQVPLMIVQPKVVYGSEANDNMAYLPEYVLNPDIKYWLSLVTGDLPKFYAEYGEPVKYDLVGNIFASGLTADQIQAFFTAVGTVNTQLEQQLILHKEAMVNQYLTGPYGKNNLTTNSDLKFTTSAGATYVLYAGLNPMGVPMGSSITATKSDGTTFKVNDYVIPFNASQTPCILPDAQVSYYMGVVTDIKYEMKNGYLVPLSYSLSPFTFGSGKYTLNSDRSIAKYTLFDYLATKVPEIKDALSEEIEASRTAWIDFLNSLNKSSVSEVEAYGFSVGEVTAKLFSLESRINSCPIWLLENSPLEYGLFVAANSVKQNSTSVTPLTREQFTQATVFVDLISGMVVGQDGNLCKNALNETNETFNLCVNQAEILNALKTSYPEAFTETCNAYILDYQTKYNAVADEKIYPIAFGSQKLGIYRGDADRGNYVYWTYNGSEITDYFITVNDLGDDVTTDLRFAGKISAETTTYILSLVNGQLYSSQGKSVQYDDYQSVVNNLALRWRTEIQNGIKAKNASFLALKTALQTESAKIAAATKNYSASTLSQSDADRAAIATRLISADYLPFPYETLKRDTTGKYYRVVAIDPATAASMYPDLAGITDTTYCFLDFDTPNSGVTTEGEPVKMASLFDSTGAISSVNGVQMIFNKISTYSYRKQYGVAVATDGTQTLGAVGGQPALFLSPVDIAVTPGVSGETMVNVTDDNFPSVNIPSSVTINDKTFYYYYSLIMKNYYVLVVDASRNETYWMSVEDGSKYNRDGTSKPVNSPIAFGADLSTASSAAVVAQALSSTTTNNLLFAHQNDTGYMECWMPNKAINNYVTYSKFMNDSSKFDGTLSDGDGVKYCSNSMSTATYPFANVTIYQSPRPAIVPPVPPVTYAQDYYVGWDESNADHYAVDSDYVWNHLRLINDATTQYQDLCLVSKSGAVTHALFGGDLYKTTSTASPYIMTSMFNSSAGSITLTRAADENTGNMLITVVADSVNYKYQYDIDGLSYAQLTQYQLSLWKMQVITNANGSTVLVPNMTTAADGKVSLALLGYSEIIPETLPADISIADKNYLMTEVASIQYDSAQSVYYYNDLVNNGYVRLQDGVVFNAAGIAYTTYSPQQLIDLANTLRLTVREKIVNGKTTQELVYRAPTN